MFAERFKRSQILAGKFKEGQKIPNRGGSGDYSIDFEAGILRLELSAGSSLYYSLEDVTYSAIEVDDKTAVETSTGSMIARGLVGGALLGGVGLLLGGLSAAKNTKRTIKKVVLKLKFDADTDDSIRSFVLYHPGYFGGPSAEGAIQLAERIHDSVSKATQAKAAKLPSTQAPASGLAEQLVTLSELHKSGALTDAQFEQAKAKLL